MAAITDDVPSILVRIQNTNQFVEVRWRVPWIPGVCPEDWLKTRPAQTSTAPGCAGEDACINWGIMHSPQRAHIYSRLPRTIVQVFIDELPDDVDELLDLLRAEVAPMDIWHRFAVEYYRQGRKDAFREILHEAKIGFDFFEKKKLTGKEKEEFNDSRLKIINALAADLIFDLIELPANDKDRFSAIRTEILTYFSSADR